MALRASFKLADLANWSRLFTNTTSTAGTFDFTDTQSTNGPRRYYRAATFP
jgi:hypothetical protein